MKRYEFPFVVEGYNIFRIFIYIDFTKYVVTMRLRKTLIICIIATSKFYDEELVAKHTLLNVYKNLQYTCAVNRQQK